MGTICRIYISLGRAFIFQNAILPNHENIDLFQFLISDVNLFRIGI